MIGRPPLDLTHVGTNTSNEKISHFDSTHVGTKIQYPTTLKLPMESSKRKEKAQKEYIPEDPESDPSLSDSSPSEYDSSDDRKYRKSKIK